jgi:hypothetical protein
MQGGSFASGGRRGQSISLNHQLTAIFFALGSQLAGSPAPVIARCRLRYSSGSLESCPHITVYSHNKFTLRGKTLASRVCGFGDARPVYFKVERRPRSLVPSRSGRGCRVTPALLSYSELLLYPDCMNRGVVGLHDIAFNSKWTVVFRTEAKKLQMGKFR